MASIGIQVFFPKEGLDDSPSFSLVNLHGQTQCHDASREIALCKLSLFYRKTGWVSGDRALTKKGGIGCGGWEVMGIHSDPIFWKAFLRNKNLPPFLVFEQFRAVIFGASAGEQELLLHVGENLGALVFQTSVGRSEEFFACKNCWEVGIRIGICTACRAGLGPVSGSRPSSARSGVEHRGSKTSLLIPNIKSGEDFLC